MAELAELEQRITSALDRISRGLDQRPEAAAPDGKMAEELEIERSANARHVTARAEQDAKVERLEITAERLRERLEALEVENKRQQSMIGTLQGNNAALREANAQHQGAGEVINDGLVAELEDLKATRKADLAELEDIMSELSPLVKGA